MNHVLKCWPSYFALMETGLKPFDLRKGDRPYVVGDTVTQLEFIPGQEFYTGRKMRFSITTVLKDFPGLQDGYVVLGLARIIGGTDPEEVPPRRRAPEPSEMIAPTHDARQPDRLSNDEYDVKTRLDLDVVSEPEKPSFSSGGGGDFGGGGASGSYESSSASDSSSSSSDSSSDSGSSGGD